jgi:hypothetical protein
MAKTKSKTKTKTKKYEDPLGIAEKSWNGIGERPAYDPVDGSHLTFEEKMQCLEDVGFIEKSQEEPGKWNLTWIEPSELPENWPVRPGAKN